MDKVLENLKKFCVFIKPYLIKLNAWLIKMLNMLQDYLHKEVIKGEPVKEQVMEDTSKDKE